MLHVPPQRPMCGATWRNISIFNNMKTFAASKISTGFRDILPFIQRGERINISYGRAKKTVAVLVPFAESNNASRKIGILEGKASFSEVGNGKITEEEFLGL